LGWYAELLDTLVTAGLESGIGTHSLACAHRYGDSPVRIVVAIRFL
jgi:hypothetical protein